MRIGLTGSLSSLQNQSFLKLNVLTLHVKNCKTFWCELDVRVNCLQLLGFWNFFIFFWFFRLKLVYFWTKSMGVFPLILCHWSQFWHQKQWRNEIFNFKNCDFCMLLRLPASPILKVQKFPLVYVDSFAKTFLILYPSLENSTTPIAILPDSELSRK